MKSLSIALVLAAIVVYTVAVSENYCNESYCKDEYELKKHIACNNNAVFSITCPLNATMVAIDKKLQAFILAEFNEKRNKIAGGGEKKYKSACRMATMQWDTKLAEMAELNVKQCIDDHDCHNTKEYHNSGQNLAVSTFHKLNEKSLIHESIQDWYNESNDCKMEYIKKFPENYQGKKAIGHFTTMVADRNYRVGCAASTYHDSKEYGRAFQFTCNFAYTNMENEPIYTDCSKAGEKCATGKHKDYSNLCSTSEKYKV